MWGGKNRTKLMKRGKVSPFSPPLEVWILRAGGHQNAQAEKGLGVGWSPLLGAGEKNAGPSKASKKDEKAKKRAHRSKKGWVQRNEVQRGEVAFAR